ncbi:MAG: DUF1800 family protein, partial [Gammaproteobacteria bacterium]|nr:DUF1800 family protein [Gammaproteobacteria bacterium]
LGNEKPDVERNIRPDENYAREVMQLFTIGLVELNNDGSVKVDQNAQPIPTYQQDIIKGFAHVFTGWHFSTVDENSWYRWWNLREYLTPMSAVEAYHDTGEKTLLPSVTLAANQTAEQDLSMALDALFNHNNLPPFISKQLIQKFVTSNPSADYVERVTNVFIDNGEGVRGDLAAVIKAILLDDEAINGHLTAPDTFGKFREPILKATHLWRAFPYHTSNDRIDFTWPDYYFAQAALAAPSVFNFYRPDYSPPMLKNATGLLAPELEIVTDAAVTNTSNFLAWFGLWRSFSGEFSDLDADEQNNNWIDVSEYVDLTEEGTEVMMQRLNLVLTGGALSQEAIDILVESYDEQTWLEPNDAVANSIFLIMSSPQYAITQ